MEIINLFQLGVGLIPAVVVMAALIFRRQITKKRYIFAASAVLSVCIVCMLASIVGKTVEENTSYKNVSKDITLNMCYAMMGEGNYAIAGQMLDDFAVNGIYDKDVSLARARGEVLCGSYKKALAITTAVGIPADTKEMRMLSVLAGERNAPDNASATMYRAFVRAKCSHMCEEKHRKAAKLMVEIESLYNSFASGEAVPESDVLRLRRELTLITDENPELETVHMVRMAKLKTDIMSKNFASAVSRLRLDSFYDEYMIASELFMNGLVGTNDFSEVFNRYSEQELQLIANQLEHILSRQEKVLSPFEYDELRRIVAETKKKYLDPIAVALMNGMEAELRAGEVGTNAAKVHLQIGKLEAFCGDTEAAGKKICDAMNAADVCEDTDFTAPLNELSEFVSAGRRTDISRIREYVKTVLESTVPADIAKIIGDDKTGFDDVMTEAVIDMPVTDAVKSSKPSTGLFIELYEKPHKINVNTDFAILTGRTGSRATLYLNGEPQHVNRDGTFTVKAELAFGENELILTSRDISGNEAEYTVYVNRIANEFLDFSARGFISLFTSLVISIVIIILSLIFSRKRKDVH